MNGTNKPPPQSPRKIVVVVWEDIVTRADWVGDRETVLSEMKAMTCVSVGWVLHNNDDIIILVDSATKDRDYGGATVIPKSVVKSIEVLKIATPHSYLKE